MLKVFKSFGKSRPLSDLYLSVFLVGPPHDLIGMAALFAKAGCSKAHSLEEADLVVFGGGSDVSPSLYGAEPHVRSMVNLSRDAADARVYLRALELGIPMTGICRGAQFLHVMNGGTLYQHVDNHTGDHTIWDRAQKKIVNKVSSVHHQLCKAGNKGMEVIATTTKATQRWINNDVFDGKGVAVDNSEDVEAFYYRDTCCFGVQGHPEYYDYDEYAQWYIEYLFEMYNTNPDITLNNRNFYRHKNREKVPKAVEERLELLLGKTEVAKQNLVVV